MIEAAEILGGIAAAVLIVAVAAWLKLLRGPELQRLDGKIESSLRPTETASRLLVLAAALSAVAAFLACVGWIAK